MQMHDREMDTCARQDFKPCGRCGTFMAKHKSEKNDKINKNINIENIVSLTSNRGEQKFCMLWELQISLLSTPGYGCPKK